MQDTFGQLIFFFLLFNHPFIYTTYVYTQSSTHTCKSYISTVSIWHIIARTSLIFRYLPLRRRLCNERWVVLGEADKCWQKLSIVPLQAGKDEYTATDWARHDWKHLRNSCKTQGWSGKTSNANKKNKSETNLIGNPPESAQKIEQGSVCTLQAAAWRQERPPGFTSLNPARSIPLKPI